jgi:DNA-binding response OmpR family regulator
MIKVLLIDDDPYELQLLMTRLRADGLAVDAAADGPTGLQKALADRPDIIVLDIIMPEVDGIEVCQTLKRHPALGEIPVIMISAIEDREHIKDAYAAGAADFLGKPFDPKRLSERITEVLSPAL